MWLPVGVAGWILRCTGAAVAQVVELTTDPVIRGWVVWLPQILGHWCVNEQNGYHFWWPPGCKCVCEWVNADLYCEVWSEWVEKCYKKLFYHFTFCSYSSTMCKTDWRHFTVQLYSDPKTYIEAAQCLLIVKKWNRISTQYNMLFIYYREKTEDRKDYKQATIKH